MAPSPEDPGDNDMEGHLGEAKEGLQGPELGLCACPLPGDLTFLQVNGQTGRSPKRPSSFPAALLSPGGDIGHLSPTQLALISSTGGLWELAKAMASQQTIRGRRGLSG